MKSKFITLLVCVFFAASSSYGQSKTSSMFKNISFISALPDTSKPSKFFISPTMLVPPSFYSCNLAFFCRQEIKFEKITKIPFKFRLGSVQQVDYLEGKNGSSILRY